MDSNKSEGNTLWYQSVFPSDLLESIENPSFWKKLHLGFQLLKYNFRLRHSGPSPALQ